MGEHHDLIRLHGVAEARRRVEQRDREIIDIASRILADESDAIGITYAGFCLTALPHKKLDDSSPWERTNGKLSLLVEPGRLRVGGQTKLYGVPYGSLARLILLYLQTQALRAGSPHVELGRSMNQWLGRMGISTGGKTYRLVREQAQRINACRLSFFWEDGREEGFEKDSIVKGGIRLREDDRQQQLWEETVQLSETFFKALQAHPVPVQEAALREIANQSLAIDIYVWLAYRLHSLNKPTQISWQALYTQFGAGFARIEDFRPKMRRALKYALAVYPDARVNEWTQGRRAAGLELHPSRSPVAKRYISTI